MWRSETMNLYSIYFPRGSSFEILSELGSLSCIQFEDLPKKKKQPKRLFFSQAKLVNELLTKLSNIKKELSKYTSVNLSPFTSEENVKEILNESREFMKGKNISEFLLDTQKGIDEIVKKSNSYAKAAKEIELKLEKGVEFVRFAEKYKFHFSQEESSIEENNESRWQFFLN